MARPGTNQLMNSVRSTPFRADMGRPAKSIAHLGTASRRQGPTSRFGCKCTYHLRYCHRCRPHVGHCRSGLRFQGTGYRSPTPSSEHHKCKWTHRRCRYRAHGRAFLLGLGTAQEEMEGDRRVVSACKQREPDQKKGAGLRKALPLAQAQPRELTGTRLSKEVLTHGLQHVSEQEKKGNKTSPGLKIFGALKQGQTGGQVVV